MFLKEYFLHQNVRSMFLLIKNMPLNALNLIYCKFHIAQIYIVEDIDNTIKGSLEVFSSVCEYNYVFIDSLAIVNENQIELEVM